MDLWLAPSFSLEAVPAWTCPWCRAGTLRLDEPSFRARDEAPHQFEGTLRCSSCRTEVSISGTGRLEHFVSSRAHTEAYLEEDRLVFTPERFRPTFPLFPIDPQWPAALRARLTACFEAFWVDLPACAAHLRAALDAVLEGPGALREKLLALKARDASLGGELLGFQWLAGAGVPANRFQLADALRPLERCLRELAPRGPA
jgi:hypothetical protein